MHAPGCAAIGPPVHWPQILGRRRTCSLQVSVLRSAGRCAREASVVQPLRGMRSVSRLATPAMERGDVSPGGPWPVPQPAPSTHSTAPSHNLCHQPTIMHTQLRQHPQSGRTLNPASIAVSAGQQAGRSLGSPVSQAHTQAAQRHLTPPCIRWGSRPSGPLHPCWVGPAPKPSSDRPPCAVTPCAASLCWSASGPDRTFRWQSSDRYA